MKTPTVLVEKDDIHDYVRNTLLRSQAFKDSYDNGGLVYKAVEQFSGLPRFFFWPSDDVENPHFSAWWGGIQMREYDSDLVHDLYYLHEIWHAGRMRYMEGMEFDNFERKMIDNELEASVISEMAIYFEIPEIRAQTFPYKIFVDRFLFPDGFDGAPDPAMLAKWQDHPDILVEDMELERRNVMMAQNPNFDDDVEFWIQKFTHQNASWSHTWFARYDQVERAMLKLINECQTVGRKQAMDNFMDWLTSDEITHGTDIPFPYEARAFYGMYALNKGVYKDTFERKQGDGAQPVSYTFNAAGSGAETNQPADDPSQDRTEEPRNSGSRKPKP